MMFNVRQVRTHARTYAHLRAKRASVGSTVQVKEKKQKASASFVEKERRMGKIAEGEKPR